MKTRSQIEKLNIQDFIINCNRFNFELLTVIDLAFANSIKESIVLQRKELRLTQ